MKNQNIQSTQSTSFKRQIKSTVYEVNVHFSNTSTETISDKIARLLKREVASQC